MILDIANIYLSIINYGYYPLLRYFLTISLNMFVRIIITSVNYLYMDDTMFKYDKKKG